MKLYRFLPLVAQFIGHGEGRELRALPGDVVELSEANAKLYTDSIRGKDGKPCLVPLTRAEADALSAEPEAEPASDLGELSADVVKAAAKMLGAKGDELKTKKAAAKFLDEFEDELQVEAAIDAAQGRQES